MEDSDGAWFNKLGTGCPVLFMSLSVRNMHRQVISKKNYTATLQALKLFLYQLVEKLITSFKEENR